MVYDFDKFDGADILGVLQDYKVTTFCVPPTMYRMMLLNDVKKYDLSSLTHCCTAGEALNPEIFNKWFEATGHKIYEGFGQTETTLCIATIYPWTEPVPGAIGLPVPGFDVHILDSEDQSCPRGTTGEISIRVRHLMLRFTPFVVTRQVNVPVPAKVISREALAMYPL